MSLFLTVTAATQLCAGCTLEFEPTDTLGSTADPAGGGLLAELLRMGDQRVPHEFRCPRSRGDCLRLGGALPEES